MPSGILGVILDHFASANDRPHLCSRDHPVRAHHLPYGMRQVQPFPSSRLPDATKNLRSLGEHEGEAWFPQFSPDGRWLVTSSVSDERTTTIWNSETGEKVLSKSSPVRVRRVAHFSPDSQRILVVVAIRTAAIFDITTGVQVAESAVPAEIISLVFGTSGHYFATGCVDNAARVWNAETGEMISELIGHKGWVRPILFGSGDRTILTVSQDGTARLWDAETGEETHLFCGHQRRVWDARFSSDGRYVVTASADSTAKVWQVAIEHTVSPAEVCRLPARSLFPNATGTKCVGACEDGLIKIWDLQNGKELVHLKGLDSRASGCRFSPDGLRIVTISDDGMVGVWDANTGERIRSLEGRQQALLSAQFSPDGDRIVAVSSDAATVWRTETGEELFSLELSGLSANNAAFSPDGHRIATISSGALRTWDSETGELVRAPIVLGDDSGYLWIEFSPDGSRIAAASTDHTARIWNVNTGKEALALVGHMSSVWCATFSPDGRRVFTASHDGTMKVWDAERGRELLSIGGHRNYHTCVGIGPDCRYVLVSGNRGMFQPVLAGREGIVYDGGLWRGENLPRGRSMSWKERSAFWHREEMETRVFSEQTREQ